MTALARRVEAGIALVVLLSALAGPAFGQEYVIRPGDVLDVSVLGEPLVSGPATVTPDGKLHLQMAGEIQAAGLTLSQLTQKITEALKQFVREPQVIVSIRASHRLYAYVLGQVARPGAYEIDKGWTISQLVAVAGGPAPEASLARALVMRNEQTIPVDLQKLIIDGNASANLALEAGDVVIVPQTTTRVKLMGAVVRPGSYMVKPGDRLVDVLSAAGGVTDKASLNEIGVIRMDGGKAAVTRVELNKFYKNGDAAQNIALRPDDVVYVPEKSETNFWSLLGQLATLWLVLK